MNASLDDPPLPLLAPVAEALVVRASAALVVTFLVCGLVTGALLALTFLDDPSAAVHEPIVLFYAICTLYMLLQGLWMVWSPLVRAGPDEFRMRLTFLRPGLRCPFGDLVAIARAPAGRPRLLARSRGRERLYSLPLRTASRADARRLVEWLHAHVAEPGTRVLRGRGREWTDDAPFLH